MENKLVKNKLVQHELMKTDRFTIEFQDLEKIESWMVNKIIRPSVIGPDEKTLTVHFIDLVIIGITNLFIEYKDVIWEEPKEVKIALLDPTGIEVEVDIFKVKEILEIKKSDLSYHSNDVSETIVKFKVER